MDKLFKFIPLLIIIYFAYGEWELYQEHLEKLDQLRSQVPTVNMKIRKAKKKLKAIKDYKIKIKDAKDKVEQVTKEVERLQKKFPSKINDNENITMISEITTALNFKNVRLSAGDETKKDFYYIKKYLLRAEATFLQNLILLEKLAGMDRIFNISSLKFSIDDNKQKGRFTVISSEIELETYRYNINYSLDKNIDQEIIDQDLKKKNK